jgi:hypothetical protein
MEALYQPSAAPHIPHVRAQQRALGHFTHMGSGAASQLLRRAVSDMSLQYDPQLPWRIRGLMG